MVKAVPVVLGLVSYPNCTSPLIWELVGFDFHLSQKISSLGGVAILLYFSIVAKALLSD